MSRAPDPDDIRNWKRRDARVTTSGKLEAKDIPRLAAIGVRHVVNLALDDHPEALRDEAGLLDTAGIAYTHIPVPFDTPTSQHVERMQEAIMAAQGPVHIHCIMNYRVTAFFYLLDRASGMPEAEARARMVEVWDPLASEDPHAGPWKQLLKG